MKFMLLTAAALIAAPAIAQDTTTPAPTDQTMPGEPAATGTMTPPATGSGMNTTTTADPAMSQPATGSSTMTTDTTTPSQPMNSQPTGTSPQPMASGDMAQSGGMGQMTKGGYMPSAPALSGPAQPGQQVNFVPAPSPSQAFPPPAPKASYPICKAGQYDGCMQRGGK